MDNEEVIIFSGIAESLAQLKLALDDIKISIGMMTQCLIEIAKEYTGRDV